MGNAVIAVPVFQIGYTYQRKGAGCDANGFSNRKRLVNRQWFTNAITNGYQPTDFLREVKCVLRNGQRVGIALVNAGRHFIPRSVIQAATVVGYKLVIAGLGEMGETGIIGQHGIAATH